MYCSRGILLGVEPNFLDAPLYQAYLVIFIVDDKPGANTYVFTIPTQDTGANGMEGAYSQVLN